MGRFSENPRFCRFSGQAINNRSPTISRSGRCPARLPDQPPAESLTHFIELAISASGTALLICLLIYLCYHSAERIA